jgi:hypothetical protein
MDVVNANQFYSSSLRIFYNSLLSQQQYQLDSKLIAFYTILTVAVSVILLSFKQSRHLITSTSVYPYPYVFPYVKKCFKCLKCNLNVVASYNSINLTKNYAYCLNCTQNNIKYLKLKRLRNIAVASYAVTKFTCKNYLFKPINTTLIKMRKTTSKLRKSSFAMSSAVYNGGSDGLGLRKRDVNSYSTTEIYASQFKSNQANESSSDDSEATTDSGIAQCQSYPNFTTVHKDEINGLRRSRSLPKINSRVRFGEY